MSSDPFSVEGIDALFEADLGGFVAARDALVKQLKASGDKDAAAAVKALRKPTTVAWGINRVIRAHADDVDALIAAASGVRAAQARAVQGNDAGGLREASQVWRAKLNQLAAAVGALVGDQYRDEAAASFAAASVDDALTETLRTGRFTTAVDAGGFGLAGMPDPPDRAARSVEPELEGSFAPEREPEPEPDPEVDEAAVCAARDALAEREKELEKALFRLRRAEQRLAQAREAVDHARVLHSDAQAARDAAARVVAAFTAP